MKIGIIGLGYVGLTTGLGLTELGHSIVGLEINQQRLKSLERGEMPFYEEGLDEVLEESIGNTFEVTNDMVSVLEDTEAVLICVQTPSADDGSVDLSVVYSVAQEIGKSLKTLENRPVVIVKSTVIPGTTERVAELISEESGLVCGTDYYVAMVPEFLRQGTAYFDFKKPDRLVFGVRDENDPAAKLLDQMYALLDCPKLYVDVETAEFSKYASNSFLALKITFANELANIIDVFNLRKEGRRVATKEVVRLMGLDKRINPAFMVPGVGYGGSCFPKDVKALAAFARSMDTPFDLLETTTRVNENQPHVLLRHLREVLGGNSLKGKRIGVVGLSFKPGTGDTRETPARPLIKQLLEEKAVVQAWDPLAEPVMMEEFPTISCHDELTELFNEKLDAALIVTDWSQIKRYFSENQLPAYPIIDGRGIVPGAVRTIGNSHI